MRRLAAAMAILVACATSSGETWVPPWVSEPSAEERARDEYEERQRIEQRLKDIEQGPAAASATSPPAVAPVSFEAEDEATLEAERATVLREMDERYPSPESQASESEPAPEVSADSQPSKTRVKARPARPRPEPEEMPEPIRSCCKYCDKGKPCGDSCIARNKTCRVGRGCAC